MGRQAKLLAEGPSHLARVLTHLKAEPQLPLFKVRSLKLSLAFSNDHFGARHFVKEQLPRIRFANPNLDIEVTKYRKTVQEAWKPELEVELEDGTTKVIDMNEKWSTSILKELMETAGGSPWRKWKQQAAEKGVPLVAGEENEGSVVRRTSIPLPSLKEFLATRPAEGTSTPSAAKAEAEPESSDAADPPAEEKAKKGARVLSF